MKIKTFLIKINLLIFVMILIGSIGYAASVTLVWNPSTGDVQGYKVYYGTTSGTYTEVVDVGNTTEAKIADLEDNTRYYFIVRAYNSYGESSSSNEFSCTPTPNAPAGIIITVQ